MKQKSDAMIYDSLTSPKDSKKELEESKGKLKKLLSDYAEACRANGDVDENGKIRLFPKICDTPDLILDQYPMTEEQILSVKDFDLGLKYDAIDFLRGINKGKIASTMYLCVYAKYYGLKEL